MADRNGKISSRLSKIKRATLNGHRLLGVVAMVALLVPIILPRPTHADDCILDSTFDQDGKVNTNFTQDHDVVHDIAIQPDGKIIAAGVTGYLKSALARYNTDGSLDNTFDTDGKLVSRFACNGSIAYAVAIQADGKIIAAGTSYGNFLLARYPAAPSSDGTPRLGSLTIDNPITPGVSNYNGITSGSVSLCGIAPPGGLEVMLTDTNDAASVPASVIVPAGETSACFKIATEYVNEIKTGVITAQLGGVSRRATLVVRPVGLLYFTVDSYYPVPNTTVGNLQLEGTAPPGGTTVTISSSNPELASPVQQVIRFPAGTNYQTFQIRFANVPDRRIVYFKATTSGNSKTAALTLTP